MSSKDRTSSLGALGQRLQFAAKGAGGVRGCIRPGSRMSPSQRGQILVGPSPPPPHWSCGRGPPKIRRPKDRRPQGGVLPDPAQRPQQAPGRKGRGSERTAASDIGWCGLGRWPDCGLAFRIARCQLIPWRAGSPCARRALLGEALLPRVVAGQVVGLVLGWPGCGLGEVARRTCTCIPHLRLPAHTLAGRFSLCSPSTARRGSSPPSSGQVVGLVLGWPGCGLGAGTTAMAAV